MILYTPIPAPNGEYMIAYATPGAPHVLTVAGTASSEQGARDECLRRNEAQVTDKREAMVRKANMIVRGEP
jgi:hypothetical protein